MVSSQREDFRPPGQNAPFTSKSKKKSEAASSAKKQKKRKPSAEAKQNVLLRKFIRKLRRELEAKNAVLELYADHRNWVRPEEMRERLDIPEADRSGKVIDSPTQCFVGARYPWEPALKILIGMPDDSRAKEAAAEPDDSAEELPQENLPNPTK